MPSYPDGQSMEIAAALGRMPATTSVSAVATKLLELFTSGAIAPGTRLPPERLLASRLEVGRSAVREALAALEILGVVDVRPGSGTYLRGRVSELLPQSLSWGILIGERSTTELNEVRAALEIYAARLAAERMSPEAIARLTSSLSQMEASIDDLGSFVHADITFHQELALGTGNALLLDLLQIIRSLLRVWVDRAVQDPEHARVAVAEHREVLLAISRGDGDASASAMAKHMQTAGDRLNALSDWVGDGRR